MDNTIDDFGVSFDIINMRIHCWYKVKDKMFSHIRQISKDDIEDIYTAIMEACSRFGMEIKREEQIKKSAMLSYVSMVQYINRDFI